MVTKYIGKGIKKGIEKAREHWKYDKDTKKTLKRGKAEVIQGGRNPIVDDYSNLKGLGQLSSSAKKRLMPYLDKIKKGGWNLGSSLKRQNLGSVADLEKYIKDFVRFKQIEKRVDQASKLKPKPKPKPKNGKKK